MRDFFRFVGRGALGTMVAGVMIFAMFFGRAGALLFLSYPYAMARFAIPGALIGLVLWLLTTLTGKSVPIFLRMTIGFAVLMAIFAVMALYQLASHLDRIDMDQFPEATWFAWSILWFAVVGGLAGLACPAERPFTKEAKLSYWERVALDEMAELEAKTANKDAHTKLSG